MKVRKILRVKWTIKMTKMREMQEPTSTELDKTWRLRIEKGIAETSQ